MYPYKYSWQGAYPLYPMAYRGWPLNCPMIYGLEDRVKEEETDNSNLENDVSDEETRDHGSGSSYGGMQPGMGITSQFLSGLTAQPGMMVPGGKQDTFSIVLKQIQTESPEILSALIGLGISIETLRQIILRIIETANKEQK